MKQGSVNRITRILLLIFGYYLIPINKGAKIKDKFLEVIKIKIKTEQLKAYKTAFLTN